MDSHIVIVQPFSRANAVRTFFVVFVPLVVLGWIQFQHNITKICIIPAPFVLSFLVLAATCHIRGYTYRYQKHMWHAFVSLILMLIGFIAFLVLALVLEGRMP